MELKFKVNNQKINCTNAVSIAEDAVDFITASFLFNSEWDELTKTVTFTNTQT